MATVLFAWELGGGLGHMMQMAPLARALVRRGHRVYTALREVAEPESAFAGSDVCYLEAPHYRPGGRPPAFAAQKIPSAPFPGTPDAAEARNRQWLRRECPDR